MTTENTRRGRGRPKLGNVLFARRLSPKQIEVVTAALAGGRGEAPIVKTDLTKKLLEDNERLENEVIRLKGKLEGASVLGGANEAMELAMLKIEYGKAAAKIRQYEMMLNGS